MVKRDGYDWIDDPFNDEKSAHELESALRSRNTGCLIGAVVLVVAVIIVVVASSIVGAAVM